MSRTVLRNGLKTLFGIDSMNALPVLLCSDEAVMPLVGLNAPQVRQGICQRGATARQGARTPGPSCPDILAKQIVTLHWRDMEAGLNGSMRALAKAGSFGAKVTGMADGTDLEETAVVSLTGLPPNDQAGTAEPDRHANRRDCQPHVLNAVVVRTWQGREGWARGENRVPDERRGAAAAAAL